MSGKGKTKEPHDRSVSVDRGGADWLTGSLDETSKSIPSRRAEYESITCYLTLMALSMSTVTWITIALLLQSRDTHGRHHSLELCEHTSGTTCEVVTRSSGGHSSQIVSSRVPSLPPPFFVLPGSTIEYDQSFSLANMHRHIASYHLMSVPYASLRSVLVPSG